MKEELKIYNTIKYSYKQAGGMLLAFKGKLQMRLPWWEDDLVVRIYQMPNITECIYKAQRDINPELPRDYYYLPDYLMKVTEDLGKYTSKHIGDMITQPYLYKHYGYGYKNYIYNPTASEKKSKEWRLYRCSSGE